MDNFTFCSPTYFVFGRKTENEVGKYIRQFGGTKILLHYGSGSIKNNGLYDKIVASLSKEGLPYVELGGVRPNPRSGLVYEGIGLCQKENVDFILAVGGGSVIDSAKAIAAGVVYNGDFLDFYNGKEIEKALPVGTVLTIPAAGSEGSYNSVITNEKTMYKGGAVGEAIRPVFSIMNPELTFTLSAYQTVCGAADIMAHVFERYFTNTKEVEITDRFCESVLLTIIKEIPKVLDNPNDYDARANIMWAGMVAHNNICGVGRAQDWASHKLEHELSALYDVAHGAGLAVIFPAWMEYVISVDVARFAQLAVRVWKCEMDYANPQNTALAGIDALRSFFKKIGLPQNFKEIGAKTQDIPYMVKNMGVSDTKHVGQFYPIYAGDAENIYHLAASYKDI